MSLFRKRIVSLTCLFGLMALVLASSQAAKAQEVYITPFEDPPFLADTPLIGQDGWVALSNQQAALISTDRPRQGAQSVSVAGADLNPLASPGFYGAVGSFRRPVDYDTGGTQIVRISSDVLLDGPLTPGAVFFSAGIAARLTDFSGGPNPGTRGIGQIDIYSDGNVYVHDGNRGTPLFLASYPITLGEWHELALIEDVGAGTFSAEVDGVSLGMFAFPPPTPEAVPTNIIQRGTLLALSAPDTESLKKADYTAYFDNFSITVVPEPGAMALLFGSALPGAALILKRMRRVKRRESVACPPSMP